MSVYRSGSRRPGPGVLMHVRYARWALVCFMTAAPAAAQSAGSDTTGLAHIRAALERAPTSRLQVNMPTPTFKVVIEREHFPDLLSTLRSGTGSRLPRAGTRGPTFSRRCRRGRPTPAASICCPSAVGFPECGTRGPKRPPRMRCAPPSAHFAPASRQGRPTATAVAEFRQVSRAWPTSLRRHWPLSCREDSQTLVKVGSREMQADGNPGRGADRRIVGRRQHRPRSVSGVTSRRANECGAVKLRLETIAGRRTPGLPRSDSSWTRQIEHAAAGPRSRSRFPARSS